MFRGIRNTKERQNTSRTYDIEQERRRTIRTNRIKDFCGAVVFTAMAAFAFLFWLAYEGWITPDMFK